MSDKDANPHLRDPKPPTRTQDRVGVVIPIKSFNLAKGRLAESLSPTERDDLARRMAACVVEAAKPLPTWIVCDDHGVARWVMEAGARVLWRPAPGLNPAVTASVEFLDRLGFDRVIIAHGDLPLANDLTWVGDFDGVTIVPDRRGEGTNVMAVPTNTGFLFAYGPCSAPKHQQEAERLGLAVRVVDDGDLGWDIDTPDDLAALSDHRASTTTQRGTP
ncbi:MAG: 2-phospho-L-lactate guanylyltransferase [Actinomycetia bacterium]|nr:2-phospho-L-lactate guanylyltransferase [Actinomycetes bacterium]MCP5030737.1 2-phospho-L-lactate guanylyltransferase [Actinomycetes bacterium]